MLGRSTVGRYNGAQVGQSISIARRQWQVVGIFDAGGSGFDSEIWGDADPIADAARRTGYSILTVKLRSPSEFSSLRATVDADPRWNLEAKREDRFYEEAAGPMAPVIPVLGTGHALFFALRAILGAMFTQYPQVPKPARQL